MKIKKAEIYKLSIPLKAPFTTSFGTLTQREIVYLKLFDQSGLTGLGESAGLELPIYEPDFNDSTILLLKKHLIPKLVNQKLDSIKQLSTFLNQVRGNNFAKVAIESAFWHLKSQVLNKPLRQLWGGTKKNIPVGISIGLGNNLTKSLAKVYQYVDQNQPQRIKLKIKPGLDYQYLKKIRKNYPNLIIMVDANAGYTLKDLSLFKKLDQLNLQMIEQPLQYNDLYDHSQLQKLIKTPICLDESITSLHAAHQAIKLKACQIINIKPQRVGGYWTARKISKLAQKHQIPVWCGGMLEFGWGRLFNCHLATLPNFKLHNDICLTKWYLTDDIIKQPIIEKNNKIDVSSTDNLFSIDQEKFKYFTTYKQEVKV